METRRQDRDILSHQFRGQQPHTSHHGAREISSCKNKEYKKAKSFIWMFLKNNPHKR